MTTLTPAINDFLSHCRIEKNLNHKTIKAYQGDLEQLNLFLKSNGYSDELTVISKIELRAFIDSLNTLKPKTIKRKIASAKALFNYLEFEDKLILNPFRKMRINIREPKQLPSVMNIQEVSN